MQDTMINTTFEPTYFGIGVVHVVHMLLKKVEEAIVSWNPSNLYTSVKLPGYYEVIEFESGDGTVHKYHFHKLLYGPIPSGGDFTNRTDTPYFWAKQWNIPYNPFRVVQNMLKSAGLFLVDHTGKGTVPKVYAYRAFPPMTALKAIPWHTNWQIPAVTLEDRASTWKNNNVLLSKVRSMQIMAYITLPSSTMTAYMSAKVVNDTEPLVYHCPAPSPSNPVKTSSLPVTPGVKSYRDAITSTKTTSDKSNINPYRLTVHRRSFDDNHEEFTRTIEPDNSEEWNVAISDMKKYLLEGKAYNDEFLMCEGKCDTIIDYKSKEDVTTCMFPTGKATPFDDWFEQLLKSGPCKIDAVMGSSHHNAPQWFINSKIEDRITAITIKASWSVPDLQDFEFVEHCGSIKNVASVIINKFRYFDGEKLNIYTKTNPESTEISMSGIHGFDVPKEYHDIFDSFSLPFQMKFKRGDDDVTIDVEKTWN